MATRFQIVNGGDEFDARDTVDGGVMDLEQEREGPRWKFLDAIEPFDDVYLPQWTIQIEWPSHEPSTLDHELAPIPGLGESYMAHVELQIELRIFHPVRMIEVHGHPDQPAAHEGCEVQPGLDHGQDSLERHQMTWRRRRVVDVDRGNVHRGIRRLGINERCVLGR